MLDRTVEVGTDVRRTINERTGAAFLLHTQSGRCYTLNRVGTYVWQRLCGGATPAMIVRDISRQSKQSPETIEADVASFVGQLVSSGLARVV